VMAFCGAQVIGAMLAYLLHKQVFARS